LGFAFFGLDNIFLKNMLGCMCYEKL